MIKKLPKLFFWVLLFSFVVFSFKGSVNAEVLTAPATASKKMPWMSLPGQMVSLSKVYDPLHLQGLIIHPDDPLTIDFIINQGDERVLSYDQEKEQDKRLIKYFLASLTIPEANQWVNLSPYEKDRIIKDDFGKTEMGRDLLVQDYMLKQMTASLIYPENHIGQEFWSKVYARVNKEFGGYQLPVNTFNKVWIIPDEAAVYESGNAVYILRNHLKVMLEEDYLSLVKHQTLNHHLTSLTAQIVRQVIIPELEHEINVGQNFANLRQMYGGMILATWYKHTLKTSFLTRVYADHAKVKGVNQDPANNALIYKRYLSAFKKGVFNYIREDVDQFTKEKIPRKYFSGGTVGPQGIVNQNLSMNSFPSGKVLVIRPNSQVSLAMNSRLIGGLSVGKLKIVAVALRKQFNKIEEKPFKRLALPIAIAIAIVGISLKVLFHVSQSEEIITQGINGPAPFEQKVHIAAGYVKHPPKSIWPFPIPPYIQQLIFEIRYRGVSLQSPEPPNNRDLAENFLEHAVLSDQLTEATAEEIFQAASKMFYNERITEAGIIVKGLFSNPMLNGGLKPFTLAKAAEILDQGKYDEFSIKVLATLLSNLNSDDPLLERIYNHFFIKLDSLNKRELVYIIDAIVEGGKLDFNNKSEELYRRIYRKFDPSEDGSIMRKYTPPVNNPVNTNSPSAHVINPSNGGIDFDAHHFNLGIQGKGSGFNMRDNVNDSYFSSLLLGYLPEIKSIKSAVGLSIFNEIQSKFIISKP